jgi:hypothetical protein
LALEIVPDILDVVEVGCVLAMLWRDMPRGDRRERCAKGPFIPRVNTASDVIVVRGDPPFSQTSVSMTCSTQLGSSTDSSATDPEA